MDNFGSRRDILRGAVSLMALQALSACGGGGTDTGAPPVTAAPTPTPAPPSTPAPTPPPTATAIVRSKLKTAASAVTAPVLFGTSAAATLAKNSAASPIAQRTFTRQDSPNLRYIGLMGQAGPNFPLDQMTANRAVNYGFTKNSNQYFVEFRTDAAVFEVAYHGNGSNSANRVRIDGKYVTFSSIEAPNDGDIYVTRVTLPDRQLRTIRLEATAMNFYGINLAATDVLQAPPTSDPVRAVILGDSITEGTSGVPGVNPFEVYASQSARKLGWEAYYQSGVGSTGYLAAPGGKLKLRDRLATDVFPFNPEVIVIAAGFNDPIAGIGDEAAALFNDIQARLPNTQVFVVGPWGPGGYSGQAPKAAAIQAALSGRPNFFYIDNSTWQTGNGNVNAPNGSGNGDQYVGPDGVHPTQAGHSYLADRLTAAVTAVVQAW